MQFTVGDKSFKTRKPADLDAALLETTGCDAAETARHLAGYPLAGHVAAALRPFLPDNAPSVPELALAIPVGDDAFIADVRGLYADTVVTGEPAAPAEPEA